MPDGECRESHAGARQRGWRLSGLDWAAPKELITLPKHNAALYAEQEESKEGSERRSEPTTRISSAHLHGHRPTTNSPALVIRAMRAKEDTFLDALCPDEAAEKFDIPPGFEAFAQ